MKRSKHKREQKRDFETVPTMNPIGKLNLEHELDLKVRTSSKREALFRLQKFLMKEYGVLYNMRVLKSLTETSPGVWEVKLQVGKLKIGKEKK